MEGEAGGSPSIARKGQLAKGRPVGGRTGAAAGYAVGPADAGSLPVAPVLGFRRTAATGPVMT